MCKICPNCEKEHTETHGMNDAPTIICECGEKMRKKIGNGAFILKGEGFYSTDNA